MITGVIKNSAFDEKKNTKSNKSFSFDTQREVKRLLSCYFSKLYRNKVI